METGITWNNAPENNGTGGGFDSDTTLLGTFSLTGKGVGTVMFSSAAFDTFMNGVDGQTTLMIARDTVAPPDYVHAFASKENSSVGGPTLSAVPEPTSFVMFGLALVGFARRRC